MLRWEVLTVLGLPAGGEGFGVDFDLVDQKEEQALVAGGSPRLGHGVWLLLWVMRCEVVKWGSGNGRWCVGVGEVEVDRERARSGK